jgi:hypothetical protein
MSGGNEVPNRSAKKRSETVLTARKGLLQMTRSVERTNVGVRRQIVSES